MIDQELDTLGSHPAVTTLQIHQNPYIKAATSDNTRKAYRSDIRHYEKSGGRLPATPEDVINYLLRFAERLNPSTLSRRLVALRQWHSYQNFPDPAGHPAVRKTLTGILRTHGCPPQKAHPLTPDALQTIAGHLMQKQDSASIRDHALLLIGFWGAFRRSELVSIRAENCVWHPDHLEILIPHSKTDQENQGAFCSLPKAPSLLCPLTALRQWLDHANITEGWIFRSVNHSGIQPDPLAAPAVNRILRRRAHAAGIADAMNLSSHSLRRGLATASSIAGASLPSIMRQGRWKSVKVVTEYIDAAARLQDNAARRIVETLKK